MAKKKSFLLRIDAKALDLLKQLSEAEFRSLNGQIEYLLGKTLKQSGRLRPEQ